MMSDIKHSLFNPKLFQDSGTSGDIYYNSKYGYFRLKKNGNPSDEKWNFPETGQSDEAWEFITKRAGTITDPKKWYDTGVKGEYYYSYENNYFYILKENGNPKNNNWDFPSENIDNDHWVNKGTFSNMNWLSFIPDNTPINQISLPGTHDSATGLYEESWVQTGLVKTQSVDILPQLRDGVRFLDCRCRHINNVFAMHHGPVYLDMMFGDVLKQCKQFLEDNPSEFIIMSVKPEHTEESCTRSFGETFKQSYYDPELWFTEDRFPELNEVRGKMVLFNRFNRDMGIITHWKDDTTFDIGNRMHVQDHYSQRNLDDKFSVIQEAVSFSVSKSNQGWMTLNFTSVAANPMGFWNIDDYAEHHNARLVDYLSGMDNNNDTSVGIIISDFYHFSSLHDHVIKYNFNNLNSGFKAEPSLADLPERQKN